MKVYQFELLLYCGFLDREKKVRFTIATDEPAAIIESDFKDKIKAWASQFNSERARRWESRSIKYIGEVGL